MLSLTLMHSPYPPAICQFKHLQAVYTNFRSFGAPCYCTVNCSTSILMSSDSYPALNTGRPVLSSPLAVVGCDTRQYLQLVASHAYQSGAYRRILQWTNVTMDLVQTYEKVTYECFCQPEMMLPVATTLSVSTKQLLQFIVLI